MQKPQLIIFTDLDGTLLDHHNYSWQPARQALEQLRQKRVPLILTTSKTAAEVSDLHRELHLDAPFIIENGSGIILPQSDSNSTETAHFFGKPYSDLIAIVHRLRRERGYRFHGFRDYSTAEIAAHTGLTPERARQAKQRLCSEPLCWEDSEQALETFSDDLRRFDLQLLRGGRFYHVLARQADKGTAVRWLLAKFRQQHRIVYYSIGLGDGPNDRELLEAVDLAVIIPAVSGLSPRPQGVNILRAEEPGPGGWNRAILQILATFEQEGAIHG